MKLRAAVCCSVLALAASACGSRLSDSELSAGAGSGGGGGKGPAVTDPSGPDGGSGGEAEGPKGVMFGTLESPCGPAPEGQGPVTPGQEGVSDDAIKIAVISDKAGVVKVPTASIEESMMAMVQWCNDQGGVNGRKLELTAIDSGLVAHLPATQKACESGVFAIVGSGSVQDHQGAQAMVDCGLIEVPAYTATAAKAMSDRMVTAGPNPSNVYNVAPVRWIASQYPDAVKAAALFAADLPTATDQAERVMQASEKSGFTYEIYKPVGVVQESFAAEAADMKKKGIKYVTMISATSETVKLLRDMKTQGFVPELIELGQQYYDPELLAEPGAEGALVQLNTVPFEEADDVPALRAYLDAYDKVGTDIAPTSLGVQSFSSGLLFAQALKNVGDDITRESVLAALKDIHEWDGGGLHYVNDPGANKAPECFMYMQVKNGEFVRKYPEEPGTFECVKDSIVELTGTYVGAKEK